MAVTKIKPVKSTLSKALDYIQNPDKTDGKTLVSSFGCSYETADIEFEYTLSQARQKGNNLAFQYRQERENMADQTIPDYETIRAAVAGETWAVEKVLMCYKDEIDRQATVKKRQPDGTFKLEIDEDMRQYITMKLIESLPQFPLEEMEREEKRNRDKKS